MGVRDKAKDAATIYQLAKELLQLDNYEQMLDALMRTTLTLVGADRGFLVLLQKNGTLRYQVIKNWQQEELLSGQERISRSILKEVMQGSAPILIEDALQDPRFESQESVRALEIRSVLSAPLIVEQKTLGAIYLESRNIRHFFGPEEFSLFTELLSLAHRILSISFLRLLSENANLARYSFPGFITKSEKVARILEMAAQVAPSSLPVLIQGPSGTGKELLARGIHRNSERASKPFITVNCAALAPSLLESELFGHVKGSFTGATQNKEGLIATAHSGTLFLDEMGELPRELQSKLLRVLQFGEVQPIGASKPQFYQVRFIAATNRDLQEEVRRGNFREDLFFRLNAVTLTLPPLKERPEDVLPLFHHFLQRACTEENKPLPELSEELNTVLQEYEWPGNIRELENETRRLVALSNPGTTLTPEGLSERLQEKQSTPQSINLLSLSTIEEQEKALIEHHLKLSGGNRTHAAQSLGITREGLRKKMKRFGIQ